MKIGDIDVANNILTLEYQLSILQQTVGYIIEKNGNKIEIPTLRVVEEFQKKALSDIQKKYPSMDVKKR